jgi:hypothetical protein
VWNALGDTWYGTVNHSSTTRTQNIRDLRISDAEWTTLDAALNTLETTLRLKLLHLTVEQRSRVTQMGDKSEVFKPAKNTRTPSKNLGSHYAEKTLLQNSITSPS